jgi:hypothetical protein
VTSSNTPNDEMQGGETQNLATQGGSQVGQNGQGNAQGATGQASTRTEEFQVSGEALLAKVKELIHEGNVRRILLKNEEGHVVMEFPLTAGVVGALLLPTFAAVGAIAALVAKLTIVVERRG